MDDEIHRTVIPGMKTHEQFRLRAWHEISHAV